jgi:hypothetical protein
MPNSQPTVHRRASNRRTSFEAEQDPTRLACCKIKRAKELSRHTAQAQFESGPGLKRSRSLLALPESDDRKKKARKIESAYVSRYNKLEYVKVMSGFVDEVNDDISALKERKYRVERENEILRLRIESMRCGVQYGIQLAAVKAQAQARGSSDASLCQELVRDTEISAAPVSEKEASSSLAISSPSIAVEPVGEGMTIHARAEDSEVKIEELALHRNDADEYASEIDELLASARDSALDHENSLDSSMGLQDDGQFLVDKYMCLPVEESTSAPGQCNALSSSSSTCFTDDMQSSCSFLTEIMEGRGAEEHCDFLADPYFEKLPFKSEPVSPTGVADFALQYKDVDSLPTRPSTIEAPTRWERVTRLDDAHVSRPVAAA